MKKLIRCTAALLCGLMLFAMLPGCGESGAPAPPIEEQVHTLVQGNLDLFYAGQVSELYKEQVGMTEEDVKAGYDDSIRAEVEYFVEYFQLVSPSAEATERLENLYRQIYAQAKYTVGEAALHQTDEYVVPVTVRPVNVMELAIDTSDTALASFRETYAGKNVEDMTEEEKAVYENDWTTAIIDMVDAQLPNLGYKDAEELTIHVRHESDGVWRLDRDDLTAVDIAVIYYPED